MSFLSEWLESIGLQRYLAAFELNDIDVDTLPLLDDGELKSLGVSLGHRKQLLQAIAELNPAAGSNVIAAPSPPGKLARSVGAEGERRQLTVLFCDLVGSTELSARMDPEVERGILRSYWDLCTRALAQFEGYFFQCQGDGIVAYFGFPVAQEEAPERAIRAGLKIVESMNDLAVPETGPLKVRIGISTGLVVISDLRPEDRTAVGDTMNLAARLQTVARPGTIVVSDRTRRLAAGSFEYEDLGAQLLKGFPQPVHTWRVVGLRHSESRFEAATRYGLTPLVGRRRELTLLLRRWELVERGQGQALVLSGDAGVGKSRMLRALRTELGSRPARVLRFQCSPFFRNSALYPVADYLEEELGLAAEQPHSSKLARLEALMINQYSRPALDVGLIASMMALPVHGRYPPLDMTPQRQKQETIRALIDLMEVITRGKPSLVLFEDIHWADPTTLDALDALMDRVGSLGLLLLISHRPELRRSWKSESLTLLSVSRLSRAQSAKLVLQLGGNRLSSDLLDQILDKADGMPLYLEELTKSVLESELQTHTNRHQQHAANSASVPIPPTLRDSLMARLDRLLPVKEVAQIGSVFGREFSFEMLRAVVRMPADQLHDALQRLMEAGLIFRRGARPDANYVFKHALIQDAAYDSILRSDRQKLHQKVAAVLDEGHPATREARPELLAHHFTEGGLREEAVPLWCAAGKNAAARSANIEAIAHLSKGLDVLKSLPYSPKHDRQELLLNTLLGNALMATRGYGAPEVGRTFDRARELCDRLGETPQLFPVLRGLWMFYLVRSELETARALAHQIMQLATQGTDESVVLEAHRSVGMTHFFSGEFCAARRHLEEAIALYDLERHREHAFLYGTDPGVACLCYLAATLWILGFADEAVKKLDAALHLADKCGHAFSRSFALSLAAMIHQCRRDPIAAQKHAELDIVLSNEEGFVLWLAQAMVVRGWARAEQGRKREGLAEMRQGIAAYQATGARLSHTYTFSLLAEVCKKDGRPDEGLSALTEAFAAGGGERVFEAELYRLRGELTLELGRRPARKGRGTACASLSVADDPTEGESLLVRAIDIARAQEAKAFELRATSSLCRLWQAQGKGADARGLLGELYNSFAEGLDTRDLCEARQLLEELG